MKNEINVRGLIAPAELDWLRPIVSPYAATFPSDIGAALKECDPSEDLNLRIDSPGGFTDAGRSMIADIQNWCSDNRRRCNVRIGGLAASMAAVMAVSFTGRVSLSKSSLVMFHSSKTTICNDATAEELRDSAEALDKFNRFAAETIASRSGMTYEAAFDMIKGRKETFLSPEDMIALKLADEILVTDAHAPAHVKLPSSDSVLAISRKARRSADAGMLAAACAIASYTTRRNKGEGIMPTDPNNPTQPSEPAQPAQPAKPAEPEPPSAADIVALRAEVKAATARAEKAESAAKDAAARAEAAEKALADTRAAATRGALTPPGDGANHPAAKPVATAWREAVRACGNDIAAAKAKHPDIYEALRKGL